MKPRCSGNLSMRCESCSATTTIDVRDLALSWLETWEPSLIVDEIYGATTQCACGAAWELRLHLIDGYVSAYKWDVRGAAALEGTHIDGRERMQ